MTMTDREKFEAWYLDHWKTVGGWAAGHTLEDIVAMRGDDGEYIGGYITGCWHGFQAALASQQPVAAKEVFNLGHCTHEPDFTRSGMICTSDEQAAHQQADDGWIELEEGAIPVHPETLVEIKIRNGATDGPGKAGGFLWYIGNEVRDEMGCDVIAYRVVKP